MDQFPLTLTEKEIQQAKENADPLTREYLERLEWVARAATSYQGHTTAFTPDGYQASGALSAALSRITLGAPAKSWREYVTSGQASTP